MVAYINRINNSYVSFTLTQSNHLVLDKDFFLYACWENVVIYLLLEKYL